MTNPSKRKKTLLIGATHGDEAIGVAALLHLRPVTLQQCDWMIGNPRAFLKSVRYTEQDLNRSAPGDPTSPLYESKRAAEILRLADQYDYTIDIHGTVEPTGIFLIITNPKRENWQLAASLPIDRIVYWPSITPELAGPLSEYLPCGLEIECGPKTDPTVLNELTQILEESIQGLSAGAPSLSQSLEILRGREIYEVTGSLSAEYPQNQTLQEFKPFNLEGETRYPLLIGTYTESYGITCFTMTRKDIKDYL